jgi:hypothetical protein
MPARGCAARSLPKHRRRLGQGQHVPLAKAQRAGSIPAPRCSWHQLASRGSLPGVEACRSLRLGRSTLVLRRATAFGGLLRCQLTSRRDGAGWTGSQLLDRRAGSANHAGGFQAFQVARKRLFWLRSVDWTSRRQNESEMILDARSSLPNNTAPVPFPNSFWCFRLSDHYDFTISQTITE